MIAIRERTEIAFIVPERRRAFGEPEQDADRRESDQPSRKQAHLHARFAQFQLLRANDIEPAHACEQTEQTGERDPGLWTYRRWKLNREIGEIGRAPLRLEKPIRRQKWQRRANQEREQSEIDCRPERKTRRTRD